MKERLVEAAVLLGPAGMEVEGPEICWRSVMDVYILYVLHTVVIDSVQGFLFLHWLIVIRVF
jgi:hypothetical protein